MPQENTCAVRGGLRKGSRQIAIRRWIAAALAVLVLLAPVGVAAQELPRYSVPYDSKLPTGLRFDGVLALNLGYGWVKAQFVGPLPWMDCQILIQNHRVTYLQFAYRAMGRPQVTERLSFVRNRVTEDTLSEDGRLLLFMLLANFWPPGYPPNLADDPLLGLGIWLGAHWTR